MTNISNSDVTPLRLPVLGWLGTDHPRSRWWVSRTLVMNETILQVILKHLENILQVISKHLENKTSFLQGGVSWWWISWKILLKKSCLQWVVENKKTEIWVHNRLSNRCNTYWLGNLKQMLYILARKHVIECPWRQTVYRRTCPLYSRSRNSVAQVRRTQARHDGPQLAWEDILRNITVGEMKSF